MTLPRADHLLRGLDEDQVRAVTAEAPVVRVLAGPGSGKTRVLTRRVAYRSLGGTVDSDHCLVVTFTRAAAAELSSRLAHLGIAGKVAAGTLHATAWGLLKHWWASHAMAVPAMAERDELLRRLDIPGEVGVEIGWAAARMLSPGRYEQVASASGRLTPAAARKAADAMDRYRSEKARRGMVDHDDVLSLCARAFEEDAGFAQAQRWRFRHLFVDEFQDLTPLQFRLIDGWGGGDPDLFVVGDPRQAVYSWNGSDPALLEQLHAHFPGTATVELSRNYRCSPAIATVAASVLEGTLPALRATRQTSGSRASATTARPDAAPAGVPRIHHFDSDRDEASGIARLLRQASARGTPWSKMAVLVRTNALALSLARRLRSVEVPVTPITFHRAKGLEFETVVVACLEEGFAPLVHASSPDAIAEERRLLYVAMTRAAIELHLTWASRRGRAVRNPSPYLSRIERECRNISELPATASSAREGLRAARAALGPLSDLG